MPLSTRPFIPPKLRNLSSTLQIARRCIAIALAVSMMGSSLAAAETVRSISELARPIIFVGTDFAGFPRPLMFLFGKVSQDPLRTNMPHPPAAGPGIQPQVPLSRSARASAVVAIKTNIRSHLTLRSHEPVQLAASPLDSDGNVVQGLAAKWTSSNREVVFVDKAGRAMGGRQGTAIVTATVGTAHQNVRVTVVEGTFRNKKTVDSRRAATHNDLELKSSQLARLTKLTKSTRASESESHHVRTSLLSRRNSRIPVSLNSTALIRDPNDDPLPDNETSSLYDPTNTVGKPRGKLRPGGKTVTVATGGTETGNKNFSFGIPIVSLPGRGIDVSLSLVYNSLLYHKSVDPSDSSTQLTYDTDSGYPAPGFRLGYGQLEDQGSSGFTLTDPDGTRHALALVTGVLYKSYDGSFIEFMNDSKTVFYPDGTVVSYGAAGGGDRSYPTEIRDRNGNYITVAYLDGVGPRIDTITDTLERQVTFNYDSNDDLVAIEAPGLTGQADRQVMRFYYTDLSLTTSGLFGSGVNVTKPNSARVITNIYLPNSVESGTAHIGYGFDYSPYGMIYRTKQFRGMIVSTTSLTSTGSVSSPGSEAAVTTYNYPTSASNLTDAPIYSQRSDDWAGRTTGMGGTFSNLPTYTFAVNETTGTSTVTAPDDTVTETKTIVNAGQWNHGLIDEIKVQYGTTPTVLTKTKYDWSAGVSGGSYRPSQIRLTDVAAGLTKATVFTYDDANGPYNNLSVVSERGFSTDGSVSSTVLRETKTTYVTSTSYINRRLFRLPSKVEVFAAGASSPSSRVDYAYDNYGTSHANMTSRADITMHDPSFDPFQEPQEHCYWRCWDFDVEGCSCCVYETWECDEYTLYLAATDYRGNITSVTTYPDASTTSGAITRDMTYDIAGNLITAEVGCCQLKTFDYAHDYNYAYRTSETKGSPSGLHLTTTATFDLNTGLIATITDANSQVTSFAYYADSLRISTVSHPGGGQNYFQYGETLSADAAGRYHYWAGRFIKLDAPNGITRWVEHYDVLDGRGAVTQTFENRPGDGYQTQDLEYDVLGRAYRGSNPYYTAGYGTVGINPDGFWTTSTFDRLGRVTQVTMPRGDNDNSLTTTVQTTFAGDFTTITDQAGKQRRQKTDALGRLVRLDEPDSSGSLGTTTSPNQSTSYDYDVLDNLVKITQGSQYRYFKYDSLSRKIRERQAEQTVNSNYNLTDSLTGNSSWTSKFEYNSDSLITHAYDARGVQTDFSYDGLNRLTLIDYQDSTPDANYYYDSQTLPSGAPSYTHGSANGRLIAITYGGGATGTYFGYDSRGQANVQKQVTGSTTYSLSYAYNLAGLLTSETYPNGRVVSYAYDAAARLTQVSDGSGTFAGTITYAAHDGLLHETWGNSAVHSLTYNRRFQPTEVKLKQSAAGSELQRYNYSYGEVTQSSGSIDTSKNNGQLGRVDGMINGASTKEWDQRFVYDPLGRLSLAAEYQQGTGSTPTWQVKYTHDRYGNRMQSGSTDNFGVSFKSVVSGDIDATTNRLTTSGSTPLTYDAAGNVTQDMKYRLSGSLGMKYEYDANGRQKTAKLSNDTTLQTSAYDSAGQRVQATANSVTRTMVYDIFGQQVADYNGSSLERENIYRGGQLLATYEAGTSSLKYVLQDVQGSARAMMSNNGGSSTILARHDYLPFGEEIPVGVGLRTTTQKYGQTDTNRRQFAQTERDDTTGLDHTWWRKYESQAGRWTSSDPLPGSISNPQSLNRYSYTQNDPVNFVDPSGLQWAPFITWVSCIGNDCNYGLRGSFIAGFGEGPPEVGWPGGDYWEGETEAEPKKPPTLSQRVRECAEKLFGVNMTIFVSSRPGQDGAFTGTGPDVLRHGGNISTFTIYNDASSLSQAGIGSHWNLGGPAMGFTPNPDHPFNQANGYNPYTNFTGNDITNSRVVQATQVHELGNSLARITGIYSTMNGTVSPPQFGSDRDPGVAMERCVFGGDVNSNGQVINPN